MRHSICECFRRHSAHMPRQTRIFADSLGSKPFLLTIGGPCTISFDVLFITPDGGILHAYNDDRPRVPPWD